MTYFSMMELVLDFLLDAAKSISFLVRFDPLRGFGINLEKSKWEPMHKDSWIDYDIHTQTGYIFASGARIE